MIRTHHRRRPSPVTAALRRTLVPLLGALLVGATVVAPAQAAPAAAQVQTQAVLTVAQAISAQGSSGTVEGYVVGQPVSSSSVVRSDFPSDYAMALADSASETTTSRILYVQIPSAFRSTWGLQSHPALLGTKVAVTGAFASYFSHPGLTGATAFTAAGGGDGGGGGGGGGGGTDPSSYYDGTSGLTGSALKAKLHTIISTGVTTLSYDQVWDGIKDVDTDPANPSNVIELYTGWSVPKSSNGTGNDDWNREHVWAKSHGDFGTSNGPGTDLHHLRPADVTVNSARNNRDFAEGGTQSAEAPGNYYTADSWEPRDADKGDVARMIFYMDVRWEGGDGKPDLEVNSVVGNGTAPYMGKLADLKKWNDEDPPSAFEKTRNEKIFSTWQHNRNPFIDHPEWVDQIWP